MGRMLRRNKVLTIVMGIAVVALGVAVIGNPEAATLLATNVVGWILVAAGVIGLAGCLMIGLIRVSVFDVVVPAVQLALGIYILASPQDAVTAVFVMLGVVVAISGIATILDAVAVRSLGLGLWSTILVGGIVTLLLGVLIASAPIAFAQYLTLIAGISLIVSGLGQVAFGVMLPVPSR